MFLSVATVVPRATPLILSTDVAAWVPDTSPANEPVKLPAVVAVVALPFSAAVIVPALKLLVPSLITIVLAVLKLVAVVAEFATFPAVAIVASFVSTIPAAADTLLLSIAPALIVVAPALLIVTSPLITTSAAMLEPLPNHIFPLVSDDPTGEVPVIVTLPAAVNLPLLSTVKVPTCVALP
jgi:hypothetical protein